MRDMTGRCSRHDRSTVLLQLNERGSRDKADCWRSTDCITLTFTRREAGLTLPSSAVAPSPALVAARVRFMTRSSRVPARVQPAAAGSQRQVFTTTAGVGRVVRPMASSKRGGQTNGTFTPRQAGAGYAVRASMSMEPACCACMASDEVATRGLVPAASVLPCDAQPPVLADLHTAVRAGWNADSFWSCGNSDTRLRMIIVLRSIEHARLRSSIDRSTERSMPPKPTRGP